MIRVRQVLPAMMAAACLIFCCTACFSDVEEPLDLSQFSGKWFLAAGTPMNGSISKCGRYMVRQTTENAFTIKFTAVSYKKNIPIAFNINGVVNEGKITATWQLAGSGRKIGPFRHVIVFAKYDTALAMLGCYESTSSHQRYKFGLIWSRERSLPSPILKELETKLGAYINQREIRMVDHGNC